MHIKGGGGVSEKPNTANQPETTILTVTHCRGGTVLRIFFSSAGNRKLVTTEGKGGGSQIHDNPRRNPVSVWNVFGVAVHPPANLLNILTRFHGSGSKPRI